MEDFVVSIITKIAEYAVAPILNHAQYLCCFNNFAGDLPNAKRELELTRDIVKEQVKEATNKTEKIEPVVEKWLKDVEEVLVEVQMLEGRITEARKSFFRRQCQYFLAKEIARKTEKMTQLNRNSKFDPFSRLIELPGMFYYSSKNFILFKSNESTYNMLLEKLKDKNDWMIGLHGLGGSGKTTLVKEVGKKVEELKLFDKVVFATVSVTLNLSSIQYQIAEHLGFELKEKTDITRAKRLSLRLMEGTTLLILDDVWQKLDLEAIGIPCFENNRGCRVILTTRIKDALKDCQSTIELSLLTNGEAWTLFKMYASITDDSPDALKVVAEQIVKKCKGLPIAIVTVGSTLKGKTLSGWELALSTLEESEPLYVPRDLISPHVCLKLSYDNLTDELAKSLFIMCSIFPEDHEIDLEDLFRFGKRWGLFGTSGRMEKARWEMHVAVNILLDSCLLLHVNKKEKVKMHDMVRDVALWIASKKGQKILVTAKSDLKTWVQDETIKDMRAITLWDVKNCQLLVDQLHCPALEILLLHSPHDSLDISNLCLEGMKMLKILACFRMGYSYDYWYVGTPYTLSLPLSIESLKYLQTLCLRGSKLGDISILESLQGLEVIDLHGSRFKELPKGIVALEKLKLLDLFHCRIEKHNAYEVIGRCLQLEELYLYVCRSQEKFPYNVDFSRLKRYLIFETCKTYFSYGSFLEDIRPSRALCLNGFNASAQSFRSLSIKDLFVRAEHLHLIRLQGGYKILIPAMDQQGMNQLISLVLDRCPEIECLSDGTITANTKNLDKDLLLQTDVVFSNLVTLRLFQMDGLKEVFHGPSSQCCLKNLEELWIENCKQLYNISFPRNSRLCSLKILRIKGCHMLISLFMPSIAQTLELLEELKISNCSKLKHVIEEVEERSVDYFSSQSHSSLVLQKLRILDIERCESLEYIFPAFLAQGLMRLEKMRIHNSCELKYVFGKEKEHHLLLYQNHNSPETKFEINLLNFRRLSLNSLSNLIDIWPEYCHPCSPNLKELEFIQCPNFSCSSMRKVLIVSHLPQATTAMEKEILWVVDTTFHQLCNHMFPPDLKSVLSFEELTLTHFRVEGIFQLEIRELGSKRERAGPLKLDLYELNLNNLPELKFIWKGPTKFLNLQALKYFCVDGCPKLKTIFSPTIVRSLPLLEDLEIFNCEELEQIFDSGNAQELKSLFTCSQQVCFPKLSYIKVQKCNKLKCLFYNFSACHFPSLWELEIKECSQLEKAFSFEHGVDEEGQEGTAEDGEQAPLQWLEDITLRSLLNFREIHHGFKLKADVEHIVEECPKYSPRLYLYSELEFFLLEEDEEEDQDEDENEEEDEEEEEEEL